MNRNQPSKEIFKELFKLFDKYGDNLILYCHSNDSNQLACNLAGKNKLEKSEIELLENVKNVLGRNHLDKLHKLKFTYEKYKKDGKGAIKFAFSDGEKFFMSMEEIIHGNKIRNNEPSQNRLEKQPIFQSGLEKQPVFQSSIKLPDDDNISEHKMFINAKDINDIDDTTDTDDSDDTEDSDDTDYILGGKKSMTKKSKKKAKKKMKKTPAGLAAKESKKQAKLARKKASATPEGLAAKEARKKLKKVKKTGTEAEIREAKVAAKAAKRAAKMTPEGQAASIAKKRAKESKKAMKSTPEAQAYKEAKRKAKEAKIEKQSAVGEEKQTLERDVIQEAPEAPTRISALKNTLRESVQQGIEQAGDQIVDDVSRTATNAISGTISGITDRLRQRVIAPPRFSENDEHNVPDERETHNVVPFLEKMFKQTSEQASELTGMINTAIQNDNKIISLLEKISGDVGVQTASRQDRIDDRHIEPAQQMSATSPNIEVPFSETSQIIEDGKDQ